MTSLRARIEPLLARVHKPARCIGCEDGAATPRHPGKVPWPLAYPDTHKNGSPSQGLQILHENLNRRDDAVAERTSAPLAECGRKDNARSTTRVTNDDLSVVSSVDDSIDDPRPRLCAGVATTGSELRATELVADRLPALDPVDTTGRVSRTQHWIERDGVRREVLPVHLFAPRAPRRACMRRDFHNGQPRHAGHGERNHPIERRSPERG